MVDQPEILSFNRGRISRLGLARIDIKRAALSAETMTNWMPRTLGPMSLRPGMEYIGTMPGLPKLIPFVADTRDEDAIALIELSDEKVRVWNDDGLITRVSVSSAVTNGTFTTDLTGWTDSDESGGTSAFVTGGYMGLTGNGSGNAIRDQEVMVSAGDQNKRHALNIEIERGPVVLKVGSSAGGDEYIQETVLRTGSHSLAFTPTGNFHIRLQSVLQRQVLVDSVAVASSGVMEITAPWDEADLYDVRWDQSIDVVFVAVRDYRPYRIERRAVDSWSVVHYDSEDGPYRIENTGPITIASSAIVGNVTLTASKALFRDGHEGALFKITSQGQRVEADISAENTFTAAIQVTGVGATRRFTVTLTGTWSANVSLQRSIGEEGNWTDVQTFTTNTATTPAADGLDNQIVFYRIGVPTGDYTSGTVEAALDYPSGSITGVARILSVTNSTTATAEILSDLGGTAASEIWAEGEWSGLRGYPSAVALFQGRLWWAGKTKIWGSVSDAFEDFNPDTEGDSAPINRSIGSGPLDSISWMLPLLRLNLGAGGGEFTVRSTSLDEPVTRTNFSINNGSSQGSAPVGAVKVDSRGIFVQESGTRIFELAFDADTFDYASGDLTALVPEIGDPSIVSMAAQRQPDTRLHAVRSDGTLALLVSDKAEEVRAWIDVETDGDVVDCAILPGTGENRVYYAVKRTVDGTDVYYLEKWAKQSECVGGTLNKQLDSFLEFTNSPASATVTGLSHLEGLDVAVWADGKCLADADGDIALFTVSSGSITLTNGGVAYEATTGIVGLPYQARYKSVKLAYASPLGTALMQRKKVSRIGVLLADTHAKGLRYGQSFDALDDMPGVENGADVDADHVWEDYDEDNFSFPGEWSTDSRICLVADAPRPATVCAAVFVIETHPKI